MRSMQYDAACHFKFSVTLSMQAYRLIDFCEGLCDSALLSMISLPRRNIERFFEGSTDQLDSLAAADQPCFLMA